MISNATIASMFVPVLFSFLLFIGLIFYYKKKTGVSVKPVVLGGVGFIVFTQVLEKVLHVIVITNFPNYAQHPFLFGLYGGFAAGIFEEIGRFLIFIWLLKTYREYKDGISFGIGWGSIEAIFLMLAVTVPNIIFAFMMNAGTFDEYMAAQLPPEQVAIIKESLVNNGVSYYLLATLERFFAVFMQIALTLIVFFGVIKKKFSYVLLAIVIHAAIDFPLVFFQTGHITNLWFVELYVVILGVCSLFFIRKTRLSTNNGGS